MASDRQGKRLYAWEDAVIVPLDPTPVPFDQADGFVKAVWKSCGLRYPPAVELIRTSSKRMAHGNRFEIGLPRVSYGWLILHELSHSMTTSATEDSGNRDFDHQPHGPIYAGVYCGLLERFMRLDRGFLESTTRRFEVDVKWDAKPTIID